jgi:hypothetical protein
LLQLMPKGGHQQVGGIMLFDDGRLWHRAAYRAPVLRIRRKKKIPTPTNLLPVQMKDAP